MCVTKLRLSFGQLSTFNFQRSTWKMHGGGVEEARKHCRDWVLPRFGGLPITSLLVRLLSRDQNGVLLPSGNEERPAIIGVFI